jgi:hypothetical protein
MRKGKILSPKKITILIPNTKTLMTFFVTRKPDGKNLVCKFDSYKNAQSLMIWANRRLGDRFDFLKTLEDASLAAVMTDNIDVPEFSMDFSTETLHRLMKKIPPASSPKKPVRSFKNLFGLLRSHPKDGYDLSDDDFSTDTSSDEYSEDSIIESIRKLQLAEKEKHTHTKAKSSTSSTSIANQLVNPPTQAEIDLQKAILASHQDEEKLTIPKPRSSPAKAKPKSIPSSTISSSVGIGHFSLTIAPKNNDEHEKIAKPTINMTNNKGGRFG